MRAADLESAVLSTGYDDPRNYRSTIGRPVRSETHRWIGLGKPHLRVTARKCQANRRNGTRSRP